MDGTFPTWGRLGGSDALRITDPRYGRLKICVTRRVKGLSQATQHPSSPRPVSPRN
jgi:hypothetical protein